MKKSEKKFQPMISAREARNMTQAEFAELLGISSNYVHLIEAGHKPPGPKILEKLKHLKSFPPDQVEEEPDHYTVSKEFKVGTLRSAELPGIHDADDAAIEENADYFYNELVKPHGIKARPGNIHSLIQYLVEMQDRSVKYWHNKNRNAQ
jgi:transcriptional regulator with XRE-family HTH domain